MDELLGYLEEHEETMRVFYRSLPEDHRRRYAATEALKIGYGGVTYIARTLGISRRPIYRGIDELAAMRGATRRIPSARAAGRGVSAAPGTGAAERSIRPRATRSSTTSMRCAGRHTPAASRCSVSTPRKRSGSGPSPARVRARAATFSASTITITATWPRAC
jgi:hypothetical protein